jgi:hypothetical protein
LPVCASNTISPEDASAVGTYCGGPCITAREKGPSILITSSIKKFLVTGRVTKGGIYTYSYKLNLTKHGNTLVAIELSIDTQAHTQLIAVGNPTAQALMQHNQHQKGTSKQASLPSSSKNGLLSNFVSLSSGTQSVKYMTDWYDPIGIEVNALTDYLTFSYDGSTAT